MTTMKKEEVLALFPIVIGNKKSLKKNILSPHGVCGLGEGLENFVVAYDCSRVHYISYVVNMLKDTSYVTTNATSSYSVYAFTNEETALMFKMKYL